MDSGCLKPVCGEECLKCYAESLCDDDRKKIQEWNSNTDFKFGDRKVVVSEKCVLILCNIAGRNAAPRTKWYRQKSSTFVIYYLVKQV